jgi:2'-5' RNA ligase
MAESAFIIHVSEVEPLVSGLRAQFDSSAKMGVPPHITVLYPFMPPESITAEVIQDARRAVSSIQPFEFRLATIGRFPGVLYLAPEPSATFVELTNNLTRQFPEFPPYEGKFQVVIPHLTIADVDDSQASLAEARLLALMKQHDPVRAKCDALTLIENSSGSWTEKASIPLGRDPR